MRDWEFYAQYVKDNPVYNPIADKDNNCNEEKLIDFYKTYGFYQSDTWNLDYALAEFLLPRRAYLRDNHDSVPHKICERASVIDIDFMDIIWTEILDRICEGLYVYLVTFAETRSDKAKLIWEEAKQLLFEYWENLWN